MQIKIKAQKWKQGWCTWLSNRIVEGGRLLEILEGRLVVLAHHVISLQVDLSYNQNSSQSINLCVG